ncbi:hypothetical protein MBLNU230_g3361t1 [Neophaeotheca triangularis]
MADFQGIAKEFVKYYYETFDANRPGLAPLYRDNSMLTFEGDPILGSANIVQKIVDLPFSQVKHEVSTLDAEPSNDSGGILIMVSGALLVEAEQRPMSYTQTFQLLSDGSGGYFVFNDIFRLVYPAA